MCVWKPRSLWKARNNYRFNNKKIVSKIYHEVLADIETSTLFASLAGSMNLHDLPNRDGEDNTDLLFLSHQYTTSILSASQVQEHSLIH